MDSKNKYIIIGVTVLIIVILLFLYSNRNVEKTLICQKEDDIILSNNIEKHTFNGINNKIKTEDLEVNIYSDSQDLINNYYDIISNNRECFDIDKGDKYIIYKCHYDIENTNFYKEIKNEDGNLSFSDIKAMFEEDNYNCSYK